MDPTYYEAKCFPISQLKKKIEQDLYPFNKIEKKAIVKKEKKNRLSLTLQNRDGDRKTVSLLLSVQYAEKNTQNEKNKYFINTMSWDNVVAAFKRLQAMQKELDEELLNDPLAALDENEDDILE